MSVARGASMRPIAVREPAARFADRGAPSVLLPRQAATSPLPPAAPAIAAFPPSRPAISAVSSAPSPAPLHPTGDEAGGLTPPRSFHGAVSAFKRRLLETTLTEFGGNRTRAARVLGLQRTYLLRLMREFEVHVPAATGHPRRNPNGRDGPP